jgi:hypothetical protein
VEFGGRKSGYGQGLPHWPEKNVVVHKFITQGSIEEKIDDMLEAKPAFPTMSFLLTVKGG